jgi:hypothetical protein
MSKPWKIVESGEKQIVLERDGERRQIPRPTDKADLAVYLALRPDELISDSTVEIFLTEKPGTE